MQTSIVRIKRVVSLSQSYPRSGNFDTQQPRYDWLVIVDGKVVQSLPMLRLAKEVAADYGCQFEVVRN